MSMIVDGIVSAVIKGKIVGSPLLSPLSNCQEYDYFADDEAQRVNHMQEVEKLAEGLTLLK